MNQDASKSAKSKGRPSQINVDKIIGAAIDLGLKDLSMHKLAKKMQVSTTALYRHVENKDALIALVTDMISKRVEPPQVKVWDQYLYALARQYRLAALSLPGSVEFIRFVGFNTPNALIIFEHALGVMKENGLPAKDAFMAVSGVVSHATDMVMHQELAEARADELENFDLSAFEENMPNVYWAMSSGAGFDHEENFEVGLKIIIEGLRHTCRFPQKWEPRIF